MEIIQGLQKSERRRNASRRFAPPSSPEEILVFDQDAADLAGLIAGDLDRVGRPIGRCDPMIAAIAIKNRPGAGDRQHRSLSTRSATRLCHYARELAYLAPSYPRRGLGRAASGRRRAIASPRIQCRSWQSLIRRLKHGEARHPAFGVQPCTGPSQEVRVLSIFRGSLASVAARQRIQALVCAIGDKHR